MKSKNIKKINNSEREMEKVKRNIDKLQYPLKIKQTILSMMEFKPENRIATVALYHKLRNIMDHLDNDQQMLS